MIIQSLITRKSFITVFAYIRLQQSTVSWNYIYNCTTPNTTIKIMTRADLALRFLLQTDDNGLTTASVVKLF